MAIQWSDFALQSLEEIVLYYEQNAGRLVAERAEIEIWNQVEALNRFPLSISESEIYPGTRKLAIQNFPYVVFLRKLGPELWQVVDVVHTSRKLPKSKGPDDGE